MSRVFKATKRKINDNTPTDLFLNTQLNVALRLIKEAPEVFLKNNNFDAFSSIVDVLGPYGDIFDRAGKLLEMERGLASLESSYDPNEGVDTNAGHEEPDEMEAGWFQVSANAMNFDQSLKDLFTRVSGMPYANSNTVDYKFQELDKSNHEFCVEFMLRLSRFTVRHNGPLLRHEIDPWLSRDAAAEYTAILRAEAAALNVPIDPAKPTEPVKETDSDKIKAWQRANNLDADDEIGPLSTMQYLKNIGQTVSQFQAAYGLIVNGDKNDALTHQAVRAEILKGSLITTEPTTAMPWYNNALKYLNQHELPGKADNQFILDCFKYTDYGDAGHDETPWCAAFICRVLEETGYKSTESAAADSYSKYGYPCELTKGAIVVFQWADGSHHVSICYQVLDATYGAFVGGNQSDTVRVSNYNRKFIKAIRWPVKA